MVSTFSQRLVPRKFGVIAFVWDMMLDVFSEQIVKLTLFCLGTLTEHVARVLFIIKILAGVDYYVSIRTNYFHREMSKIDFGGNPIYFHITSYWCGLNYTVNSTPQSFDFHFESTLQFQKT